MYLKKFQLTLLLGTLSFAQISTSNPQTSDVVADYQRVIKEQSARPSNGSFSAPHKITGKELRTTSVYEFVTLINSKVRGIYLLPPDMLKEADKKFLKNTKPEYLAAEKELRKEIAARIKVEQEHFKKLLATDPEFTKIQLANLNKLAIGMQKTKVVDILGKLYLEDNTRTVIIYSLYTFADIVHSEMENKFIMPAAYVILRFDKNFQLSALVSAVSDTYVFGTVPAYEEKVQIEQPRAMTTPQAAPAAAPTLPNKISTPVLYKNQLHHEIAKKVRRADFLTIELDPTKEIILLRMRPIGKDGYLVMEIPQSSTLLSFGLLLNDQIVALNGVPLDNLQALMNGLRKIGKEKSGSMLILRQNRLIKINLTAE